MTSTVVDKRPYTHQKPCPNCGHSIEFWWTSGMSDCFPHFYCDTCSSVLWRRQDQDLLLNPAMDEEFALKQIAASLPKCKCGGEFKPGVGPRCPKCKYEFKREGPLTYQARSPNMILIEGAEMLTEN